MAGVRPLVVSVCLSPSSVLSDLIDVVRKPDLFETFLREEPHAPRAAAQ
ncbi:MAG: hypothetical protein WBD87_05275 [Candidatus Acidiferrales bacterium]